MVILSIGVFTVAEGYSKLRAFFPGNNQPKVAAPDDEQAMSITSPLLELAHMPMATHKREVHLALQKKATMPGTKKYPSLSGRNRRIEAAQVP